MVGRKRPDDGPNQSRIRTLDIKLAYLFTTRMLTTGKSYDRIYVVINNIVNSEGIVSPYIGTYSIISCVSRCYK